MEVLTGFAISLVATAAVAVPFVAVAVYVVVSDALLRRSLARGVGR